VIIRHSDFNTRFPLPSGSKSIKFEIAFADQSNVTPSTLEILEDCLGLLAHALTESRHGRFENTKKALALALMNAAELPEESVPDFRAAWYYSMLLTQSRESPASVTPEMRSKGGDLLEQATGCESVELFQSLMFQILTDLGEWQRAIRFGERSLALAVEANETIRIGDLLWKVGGCYSRVGLPDHAAIAYRGALRIFRSETADPRLPVVLLALGNAVRKTQPAEAEGLYKEAAQLWEKKGQLESATPAWMNLGIVCADQQRFTEAIDYYNRVREVRESLPATPPARIGVLYNNLAGCYRRMKRFAEAHQSVERAIGILSQPGALGPNDANSYASSLGTKGLILRDEGRDAEAVEWFRRACAEIEKQTSPNLAMLMEELEYQAAALTRLFRTEEARAVEEKIASARQRAAEIASVSQAASQAGDAPVNLTEGALLIELDGGLRDKSNDSELEKQAYSFAKILEEKNLGHWRGFIRIPESTTLCYYGPEAEAMYAALEPALLGDARFDGALINVRQDTKQRAIALPRRRVN
jgi:tetratricopeptide (TPR) repeat protein